MATKNNGGFASGLKYLGTKLAEGTVSSVEGFVDFLASATAEGLDALGVEGAEEWAEKQLQQTWMNYNDADEWYNPGTGWQIAGEVAKGMGNSIPAILIGSFTGGAGLALSTVYTFASAGGNSLKEAYDETGKLGSDEWGFGLASGGLEAGLEFGGDLLGVGSGYAKRRIGSALNPLDDIMGNGRPMSLLEYHSLPWRSRRQMGESFNFISMTGVAPPVPVMAVIEFVEALKNNRFFRTIWDGFTGEAAEEAISAYFGPKIKRATYDPNATDASLKEIGMSALIGGLSGALLGEASNVVGGGLDVARTLMRAAELERENKIGQLLEQGQRIEDFEKKEHTENKTLIEVGETLNELKESLGEDYKPGEPTDDGPIDVELPAEDDSSVPPKTDEPIRVEIPSDGSTITDRPEAGSTETEQGKNEPSAEETETEETPAEPEQSKNEELPAEETKTEDTPTDNKKDPVEQTPDTGDTSGKTEAPAVTSPSEPPMTNFSYSVNTPTQKVYTYTQNGKKYRVSEVTIWNEGKEYIVKDVSVWQDGKWHHESHTEKPTGNRKVFEVLLNSAVNKTADFIQTIDKFFDKTSPRVQSALNSFAARVKIFSGELEAVTKDLAQKGKAKTSESVKNSKERLSKLREEVKERSDALLSELDRSISKVESNSASRKAKMSKLRNEIKSRTDEIIAGIDDSIQSIGSTVSAGVQSAKKKLTFAQKKLLVRLDSLVTASLFQQQFTQAAASIISNPEATVDAYNRFYEQLGSKKRITVSDLLAGITQNKGKGTFKKTLQNAMRENPILRDMIILQTVGNLTAKQNASQNAYSDIMNDTDVSVIASDQFVENLIKSGNEQNVQAYMEALGVTDVTEITNMTSEQRAERITDGRNNGNISSNLRAISKLRQNQNSKSKNLPVTYFQIEEGVNHYENDTFNIGIYYNGSTYVVYDYNAKKATRELSSDEMQKLMWDIKREYAEKTGTKKTATAANGWIGERSALSSVAPEVLANMTEAERIALLERRKRPEGLPIDGADLQPADRGNVPLSASELARVNLATDAATERIVGYKQMSEAKKVRVRTSVRTAVAAGLSEADVQSIALFTARSGMNVVVTDKLAPGENARYDGENTIYLSNVIDPDRAYRQLLAHEMWHKLFSAAGKNGKTKRLLMKAWENTSLEKRRELRQRYLEEYVKRGWKHREFDASGITEEEVAAAYAEEVFNNPDSWEYLLSEEPSLGERILQFFGLRKKIYKSDKNLHDAADQWLRYYKKLFDKISRKTAKQTDAIMPTYGSYDVENAEFGAVTNRDGQNMRVSGRDREYISAVERGDSEATQRLVDEAALDWGAESGSDGKPLRLYHGTQGFGFTELDVSKSDDGISFFATSSLETAGSYSARDEVTQIGRRVKGEARTLDALKAEYAAGVDEIINLVNRAAGSKGLINYRRYEFADLYDDGVKGLNTAEALEKMAGEILGELYEDVSFYDHSITEDAFYSGSAVKEIKSAFSKLKASLERLSGAYGNYQLYAKTDGFLILDGKGANWNYVPLGRVAGEYFNWWTKVKKNEMESDAYSGRSSTRQIAAFAKEKGYSGVLIKNIYDDGGRSRKKQLEAADIFIFFEPQSQVKSADPVTYDDDGNVIPLAKRFDSGRSDIRYSVKSNKLTSKADNSGASGTSSHKNVLTSEQKKSYNYAYSFSFLHKNFPPDNEVWSEAHRLAVWWARRKDVKTGYRTLISMNGQWYIVEKFDDAENYYQVEKRITKAEFDRVYKEIKEDVRSGQVESVQKSTDFVDQLNRSGNPYETGKSGANSNGTRYREKDYSVQQLGKIAADGRERTGRDGSGDRGSGIFDRKGTGAELKTPSRSQEEPQYKGYIGVTPIVDTFKDISGRNRKVLKLGNQQYMVYESPLHKKIFATPQEAIDAENNNIIKRYAHKYERTPGWVREKLASDPDFLKKERQKGKRFALSRKPTAPISISSDNRIIQDAPVDVGVYLDEKAGTQARAAAESRTQADLESQDGFRVVVNTDAIGKKSGKKSREPITIREEDMRRDPIIISRETTAPDAKWSLTEQKADSSIKVNTDAIDKKGRIKSTYRRAAAAGTEVPDVKWSLTEQKADSSIKVNTNAIDKKGRIKSTYRRAAAAGTEVPTSTPTLMLNVGDSKSGRDVWTEISSRTAPLVGKDPKRYKKSFGSKAVDWKDNLYIQTVDEQYGLQKFLEKNGQRDAKYLIQRTRAVPNAVQSMIGYYQYDLFAVDTEGKGKAKDAVTKPIGRGIKPIFDDVPKEQRVSFNDYLLHQLNIDRWNVRQAVLDATERDLEELRKVNLAISYTEGEIENMQKALQNLTDDRDGTKKAKLTKDIKERQKALDELLKKKKQLGLRTLAYLREEIVRVREQIKEELAEARRLEIEIQKLEANYKPGYKEKLKELQASKKTVENRIESLERELKMLETRQSLYEESAKPVFGVYISKAESELIIKQYEQAHPEWRKLAGEVHNYAKGLNKMRYEAGLISKDMYESMEAMYPHYVPVFRSTAFEGASADGENITIKRTVKRLKSGYQVEVLSIDDALASQTKEMIQNASYNRICNAIYEAAERDGSGKYVLADLDSVDSLAVATDDINYPKPHEITFFRDGVEKKMNVSDNINYGLRGFKEPVVDQSNVVIKFLNTLNKGFKRVTTSMSPAFAIRNAVRDIQDAMINSKHSWRMGKDYILGKAWREAITGGEMWKLYVGMGGFSSSVFEEGMLSKRTISKNGFKQLQLLQDIKDGDVSAKRLLKYLGGIFDGVENVNALVEQMPRFAEFLATLEAGGTVEQALHDSAEVTTNFGRHGAVIKKFNATLVPFLNPAIQGFDKNIRNITDAFRAGNVRGIAAGILKLILKAALWGMVPVVFNMLFYGDDEDFEMLREEDKENNYLIKLPNGTFLKFPKGRTVSVLVGLFNRVSRSVDGKDADWSGYLDNVIDQATPVGSITRNFFSPWKDIATNTTWYGGEIEGAQFDNVRPEDRYDESTSAIAIAIGRVIKYSPKKIHYLIDQYTGFIGDILLPATSQKAEKDFFTSNFTLDPVTNNKLSDKFYELLEETTYNRTDGDITAKYQYKYLNSAKSSVSELYDDIREIQTSDISSKEKLSQVRAIRVLINEAYRVAIEDFDKVTASIKDTEKNGYDDSKESQARQRYADAIRAVYGSEAALKAYSKTTYNDLSYLNAAGISYDDIYDYYFATKGITSDIDKKGNTVSGSKRKKTLKAIKSMSISIEQKLLLMAMRGYSIKDGDFPGISAEAAKKKLLKYVRGLNLSKEEKELLAEACGFELKKGKIVEKSSQKSDK